MPKRLNNPEWDGVYPPKKKKKVSHEQKMNADTVDTNVSKNTTEEEKIIEKRINPLLVYEPGIINRNFKICKYCGKKYLNVKFLNKHINNTHSHKSYFERFFEIDITNLESFTVEELKVHCKRNKIKFDPYIRKAELIKTIEIFHNNLKKDYQVVKYPYLDTSVLELLPDNISTEIKHSYCEESIFKCRCGQKFSSSKEFVKHCTSCQQKL